MPRRKKPAPSPQPLGADPAPAAPDPQALIALRQAWAGHWLEALNLWSRFTRLSEPRWCLTAEEAAQEGLTESFAMIRLTDQAVVISLPEVLAAGVQDYPLEVLAHEIGHHVYAPGDLTDQGRMIARIRWGLPGKEHLSGFVGNLYTDLLINNRLERGARLRLSAVFQVLAGRSSDPLWTLYMRIYELLWSLPKGSIATGQLDDRLEGDAQLGARLVRSYAREWLEGAGKFAALCLPYLLDDEGAAAQKIMRAWRDTANAGEGALPQGLTEMEAGEKESAIHPALDPRLSGLGEMESDESGRVPVPSESAGGGRGQHREPFEYGAILRSLGLKLDDHEIAMRYYRERALPYLVRFPSRILPESTEPLPEGLDAWELGEPLEEVDWTESVLSSPNVIPGFTTVQRVWGTTEGSLPRREPMDLDLYVDCSGSMPNPQVNVSHLTLAGAILVLSALRAGARVQATLWSGANQFETTGAFLRDESRLLRILTGYLGGATAFPIHLLRETYASRKPTDRPAHILVISDDGVTTMFDKDERNNSGWDIARLALEKGRAGGTLVLNLWSEWQKNADLVRASEQGWEIARVRTWEELVEFARQFSQKRYGED